MKILLDGKEIELTRIRQSEFYTILKSKRNILLFGKSGWGKSQIVKKYCEDNKLKLKIISLASKLPEAIGGIPHATDKGYYEELLSEELKDVFEDEGEGWVIFFDEINQAVQEVLNTLYGICYPMGEDRVWAGHSLSKAQIVACANLSDGTDGVTYLNDLPTPLVNRFFPFELECSKTDAKNYLKKKYRNIPQVVKYIDVMLDAEKSPRTVDECLNILQYEPELSGLLLQSKLQSALTAKVLDIQKKIKTADPAKTLKLCRQSYEIFKEDGIVQWAGEEIETEEALLDKFSEILSEEEIASIVKGEE
jgi:hypothetical protein